MLAAADVVVTASGTATAQTALHERPMVVVYKLSPLTYALGKPLVTIDTYAMANLVAGERIVPGADPGRAARPRPWPPRRSSFLTDRDRWERTRARLAETRAKLGPPGSTARVAEAVLERRRRGARAGVKARGAPAPTRRQRREGRLRVMRTYA